MIGFRILLAVAVAACCGLAGCTSSAETEDEHLEHHVPAHYPASYEKAVQALYRRIDRIEREFTSDKSTNLVTPLTELTDILAWMPEIAAASDLRRSEWEDVQKIARELETTLAKLRTELDAGRLDPEFVAQFRAHVKRLETLVDESQRNDVRLPHGP